MQASKISLRCRIMTYGYCEIRLRYIKQNEMSLARRSAFYTVEQYFTCKANFTNHDRELFYRKRKTPVMQTRAFFFWRALRDSNPWPSGP